MTLKNQLEIKININNNFTASAGRVIGGKPGTFVQQSSTEASAFSGTAKPGGPSPASIQQAQAGKAPQFLQKLIPINARQGENVKFVADYDGTPPPAIQWTCNGRVLSGGRDQKVCLFDLLINWKIKIKCSKSMKKCRIEKKTIEKIIN
jgi:hypothetical protein